MTAPIPDCWKVALAHHWLVAHRGGERVFEEIAELFPAADIFTLVCDPRKMPDSLAGRSIRTSALQWLPKAASWYPYYLPLYATAAERMDLTGYDLVISSDAATVKAVRTASHATHICYCHAPMRYVWSGYEAYQRQAGPVSRAALKALRSTLCRWDYEAAQRVTHFVANSRNVQRRIREYYGRESVIVYPPVDTDRFFPAPGPRAGFFLLVSQLVPYKRVDLVVEAFNRCGRPLLVIGDGPERRKLEPAARPNIRFAGFQPGAAVLEAMQRCKAFVFGGEEDFGIVLAEAQACGTPVVALGRGGALEIVEAGVSGLLFEEDTAECLLDALERLDRTAFDPARVRARALRFGRRRFLEEFAGVAGLKV
jgi:glycosyltransferase involved in cell wall biosynthesis